MAVKKFCCVQRGEKTPPEAYVSQLTSFVLSVYLNMQITYAVTTVVFASIYFLLYGSYINFEEREISHNPRKRWVKRNGFHVETTGRPFFVQLAS